MAKVTAIPLTADQYSLLQFFTSMSEMQDQYDKMREMGWQWVRENTFASFNEGPKFVNLTSRSRYSILPSKQATGEYMWTCTHPLLVVGDALMRFDTPVACAIAQEIANE